MSQKFFGGSFFGNSLFKGSFYHGTGVLTPGRFFGGTFFRNSLYSTNFFHGNPMAVEEPPPQVEPHIGPITTSDGNAFIPVQYPGPNPLRHRHLVRVSGAANLQNVKMWGRLTAITGSSHNIVAVTGAIYIAPMPVVARLTVTISYDAEEEELLFGTLS